MAKGSGTDRFRAHTEYQVLAFTGGPILSESERERRKVVSSTAIR